MKDEKIKQLLQECVEKEMDLIAPEKMEGYDHEFSDDFERKMKNLMLEEKDSGKNIRFIRPIWRTGMVVAAAICLLLIGNMSADVLNIHPWRHFIADKDDNTSAHKGSDVAVSQPDSMDDSMVANIAGSLYASIDSQSNGKNGSKSGKNNNSRSDGKGNSQSTVIDGSQIVDVDGNGVEVKRKIPAYIPEGMEQDDYEETGWSVDVKWRGKDDSDVSYIRSGIEDDTSESTDEEYQSKESIVVAGYSGFLYKIDDRMWIDWEDTKYNHFISSVGIEDENELIRMGESLYSDEES